jgi:hypothetical protein
MASTTDAALIRRANTIERYQHFSLINQIGNGSGHGSFFSKTEADTFSAYLKEKIWVSMNRQVSR